MPVSARDPLLVDTSIAVALTVADHAHHEATFRALGSRRLGLAGHAAFETLSVLTLATRDRRALDTYRALDVPLELLL